MIPLPLRRLFGWVLGLWLGTAIATSVREVSLEEMLTQAELIFEGEVAHIEVQETPIYRRPFTRVEFRVLEVIKGNWQQPTIALDFLGGESNGRRLAVEEMDYPKLGEHGIYFVESLRRRQVHPLYGWSQGRFVTFVDAEGRLRVQTAHGQPVTGLEFTPLNFPRLSRGIAKGVLTERAATATQALSLKDFKQQLRQKLDEISR